MKTVITSNTSKVSARFRSMARNLPGVVNGAIHDLVTEEAIPQFEKTVQTWKDQPQFSATATARGWGVSVEPVQPWSWVDRGTRPHVITARNAPLLRFTVPSRAKTRPNVIASYQGSRGNQWVSKRSVHHPGTEARNFRTIVLQRVQARAANKIRDELKRASYGAGSGL